MRLKCILNKGCICREQKRLSPQLPCILLPGLLTIQFAYLVVTNKGRSIVLCITHFFLYFSSAEYRCFWHYELVNILAVSNVSQHQGLVAILPSPQMSSKFAICDYQRARNGPDGIAPSQFLSWAWHASAEGRDVLPLVSFSK